MIMQNLILNKYSIQFMSLAQLDVFRTWTSAKLDRRQIAFGNLFGLDLVNINVYAKFYQTISTVQEL